MLQDNKRQKYIIITYTIKIFECVRRNRSEYMILLGYKYSSVLQNNRVTSAREVAPSLVLQSIRKYLDECRHQTETLPRYRRPALEISKLDRDMGWSIKMRVKLHVNAKLLNSTRIVIALVHPSCTSSPDGHACHTAAKEIRRVVT